VEEAAKEAAVADAAEDSYWSKLRETDQTAYGQQRLQVAAWRYATANRRVASLVAELKRAEAAHVASSLRWRDLWASHDPVPNGPAPVPGWTPVDVDSVDFGQARLVSRLTAAAVDLDPADIRGIKLLTWLQTSRVDLDSVEVFNQASLLADHTAYWRSVSDFVTRLVLELDHVSTNPILVAEPARAHAIPVALSRQRPRVLLLGEARRAALAAAVITSVAFQAQWRTVGDSLLSWIANVTDQGWLGRLLPDVGGLRGTLAASLIGALTLSVLVGGTVLATQRILRVISDGREQRLLFAVGPFPARPIELRVLRGVAVAAFVASAALLLLPTALDRIIAALAGLLSGLVVAWMLPALPTSHDAAAQAGDGDIAAAKEDWGAFLRQPARHPVKPEPASGPPAASDRPSSQPDGDV
jgi:hypothetical protein